MLCFVQAGMLSWTGRTSSPEARSRGWGWPGCSTTSKEWQYLWHWNQRADVQRTLMPNLEMTCFSHHLWIKWEIFTLLREFVGVHILDDQEIYYNLLNYRKNQQSSSNIIDRFFTFLQPNYWISLVRNNEKQFRQPLDFDFRWHHPFIWIGGIIFYPFKILSDVYQLSQTWICQNWMKSWNKHRHTLPFTDHAPFATFKFKRT